MSATVTDSTDVQRVEWGIERCSRLHMEIAGWADGHIHPETRARLHSTPGRHVSQTRKFEVSFAHQSP